MYIQIYYCNNLIYNIQAYIDVYRHKQTYIIINRQLFKKSLARSLSNCSIIGYQALWRATSSLFFEKCSYGNDPIAYGIILRFGQTNEFDIVITSQICFFWGVPHFFCFMYDHHTWLSYMIIIYVHHILASYFIIRYYHHTLSSRCTIMVCCYSFIIILYHDRLSSFL